MFDGSHYPIEENVEKTKELVKIAHENNMSIEAEVGSIGGEEDGVVGKGECADPVSYTHLDVYKRQMLYLFIKKNIMGMIRKSMTAPATEKRTGRL